MKKRYFVLIVTLVVSMFSFKVAYSDPYGSNAGSATSAAQSCGYDWCWQPGIAKGVRISFYDTSGKVGNSLDFYYTKASTTVHTTSGRKSKLEYVSGSSVPNISTWSAQNINNIFAGSLNMPGLMSTSSSDFFGDVLGMSDPSIMVNKLSAYESQFLGGLTFAEMLASPEEYYMVVEPTTVISHKTTYYYGTYAELQQIYVNNTYSKADKSSIFWITSLFDHHGIFNKAVYLLSSKEIGGSGTTASRLISLRDSSDSAYKNYSNKYGIGVMWFGDYPQECTEDHPYFSNGCVPPSSDPGQPFPECTVMASGTNCGGNLSFQYDFCPLEGTSIIDFYKDEYDVCGVICSEKYFISTNPIESVFNAEIISKDTGYETGLMAGKYYPISAAPRIYHYKMCSYLNSESNLSSGAQKKYEDLKGSCMKEETVCLDAPWCSSSEIVLVEDEECLTQLREQIDREVEETRKSCERYESTYFGDITSQEAADSDVSSQSGRYLTLNTGFKNYILYPNLEATKLDNGVDNNTNNNVYTTFLETLGNYGNRGKTYAYHNTFAYSLAGDVNRYINMESVFDDHAATGTTSVTDKNIDIGFASISTPTIVQGGEDAYKYTVNYASALSNDFKNILSSKAENIDSRLNVNDSDNQCPYTIFERKIDNICVPNVSNNYCGDPDTEFRAPKLRMIYRPIDLSLPFPGKDYSGGASRTPGSNWSELDIQVYITNNRDSFEDSLYTEKDPLYIIKLDSSNISAIRDYNQSNNYDDFTLSCTLGKGSECLSTFLRDSGIDMITGGTCADATDEYAFYSCLE